MKNNDKVYSGELSKKFDSNKTGDLKQKIDFLRECGVEETYLEMLAETSFETTEKLINVLGDKPSIEEIDIVNSNLDLVRLFMETHTSSRIRGVILTNPDDYNEDYFLAT